MKKVLAGMFRRIAILTSVLAMASLGLPVSAEAAVSSAGPTPLPHTAEFDGSIWAMRDLNGITYIGGDFTHAFWNGKTFTRSRLAAVNTATGALLPWAPTADATVDAIAVDVPDDAVYVGGRFHLINGVRRDTLAQINGTTGVVGAFNHKLTGHVDAIAVGNGLLYTGGTTVLVDGVPRSRAEAFSLATGALDLTWKPVADDNVRAILVDNVYSHRVYLGGKFIHINGAKDTSFLAAVDPVTGAVDPRFQAHAPFWVRSLVIGAGKLYAAVDGPGGLAIAYKKSGTVKWIYQFDGDPQALAFMRNVLYVGGHFDNACKIGSITSKICVGAHVPRVKLAAIDVVTGDLLRWNPQANGIVGTSGMSSNGRLGVVSVGGQFTQVGGVQVRRFAEFKQ